MNGSLELLLRELKLPAFLAQAQPLAIEAERSSWGFTRYLHTLAELELEDRRQRRVQRRCKESGLPASKTLTTLQVARLPESVRRQLPTLCEGHFVDKAQNVLAFGLPGRGKTHVLCAVGHALVERGYRVLFTPAYQLIQRLLAAKQALRLEKELHKLDGFAAIIVDDIGYLQQSRAEMEVLFTFLAERYERKSVLISSNLVFRKGVRPSITSNPCYVASMSRNPRIHYPGAVYHAMLRGNGGQAIFFTDEDRCRLELLLQEGVARFGCRIHGYCLMPNHIHLAIQVGTIPLSRFMQNVSFRYTRWINSRTRRTGHLFQGRYKAIIVDADSYLLELVRYIHLNPVRAGLVATPEAYVCSGHQAYLGETLTPWLTTEWILSHLASQQAKAQYLYRQFVQAGIDQGHRKEFHRGSHEGRALGDEQFVEDALQRGGERFERAVSVDEVIAAVLPLYGLTEADLSAASKDRVAAQARALAAWLVRGMPGITLVELARRLNRDAVSLSNAARRLEVRLDHDPSLKTKVRQLGERFRIGPNVPRMENCF